MRKFIIILLLNIFTINVVLAASDGENKMSKNSSEVKDCFEKVNRATFAFNQGLDNALFEPLAKGYRKLPSPIRIGTSNILSNLSNLMTIPNNILQGDLKTAGINAARLTVNTTIGIFGIFDAASQMGFVKDYKKEDYGQTLGSWGVGEGCYLVLPVLGPSTVRDMTGSLTSVLGGDPWYNVTVKNDTQYFKESDYFISKGGDGINFRAKNIDSFNNLEKNSMDFYASVRSLYLQDRRKKILNSDNVTETQDDSDWDELKSN
ncbi:VacJ family lipoprotein [Pelagibacterales bacterium SAG-MED15]|nr:VacJ family lipoprotein [Pelagibacterales bacterium SAG-MED15]